MNEVVKTIINHKYSTKKLNKQAFICRRSKNNRIQNKMLGKLLVAYLKENPVKAVGKVAIDKGKKVLVLDRFEDDLSRL